MNFHTTRISGNRKTGPIAVVTASRDTCPTDCPLKNFVCYAEQAPLVFHWNRVTRGERGGSLDEAMQVIDRLPKGSIWRYGQAGDLPGNGNEVDVEGLERIIRANRGKQGIVFTHKPPTPENVAVFAQALDKGLVINLSANDSDHADELSRHGLPIVTVLPSYYGRKKSKGGWVETLSEYRHRTRTLKKTTSAGRRIAICPATYMDVSCAECAICAKVRKNGTIVGFPAHGVRKERYDGRGGA